ncbi:hypothetical protein J6590_057970 [Homalodisca vitripennis]|nr:hypothetical protein J6590_057970 [Homalodisca vitripennis]
MDHSILINKQREYGGEVSFLKSHVTSRRLFVWYESTLSGPKLMSLDARRYHVLTQDLLEIIYLRVLTKARFLEIF